jgi:hypothetical protein
MSSVSSAASANVASAVKAVGDIMKTANKESIDAAANMVKVATQMKVGPGSGNGNSIDCFG